MGRRDFRTSIEGGGVKEGVEVDEGLGGGGWVGEFFLEEEEEEGGWRPDDEQRATS